MLRGRLVAPASISAGVASEITSTIGLVAIFMMRLVTVTFHGVEREQQEHVIVPGIVCLMSGGAEVRSSPLDFLSAVSAGWLCHMVCFVGFVVVVNLHPAVLQDNSYYNI